MWMQGSVFCLLLVEEPFSWRSRIRISASRPRRPHSREPHPGPLSRRTGHPHAILKSAEVRMRPVLMTSLAAAIGLIPAAVATGIGAQAQQPLARRRRRDAHVGGVDSPRLPDSLTARRIAGARESRRNGNRRNQIPQGTACEDAVERIAGDQDQLILPFHEGNRRGPCIDDLAALHQVTLRRSLICFDHNLILPLQPTQKAKMGVAMTGHNGRP